MRKTLLALAALTTLAGADNTHCGSSVKLDARAPAFLFGNLGRHHLAVTTGSPEAQQFFDQGLILAYSFNHAEALRSFQAAALRDPGCAIAFWGQALVLGPFELFRTWGNR